MQRSNSSTSSSDEEYECPIANTFHGEFILNPDSFYRGKYDHQCKMVVKVQEKIYDHEEGKPHWYYIDYKYYYIGKSIVNYARSRKVINILPTHSME